MDTYEGDPESPESLHKYLYADASPANEIDPSGEASPMQFIRGIAIHVALYLDFRTKVPDYATNRAIATLLGIKIPRALMFLFPELYGRPDLVAKPGLFRPVGFVYEIKSALELEEGAAQLALYLDTLNVFDPMHREWLPGDASTYLPRSPITVLGKQYRINPPVDGVITYEELGADGNPKNPILDPALVRQVNNANVAMMIAVVGMAVIATLVGTMAPGAE